MSHRIRGETVTPISVAQFHAALDAISDEHERAENFRLFLEAAYCSRALATTPNAQRARLLEARFATVAQAYENKQMVLLRMKQLLRRLAATVAIYRGDFLTEVYVGLCSSASDNAQCRIGTSYDTAAQILCGLLEPRHVALLLSRGHPISLHLAHAGAGSQVLAMAAHLASMGVDPRRALYAELIERDRLAYQIAFLQLSIRHVPALCICADTVEHREFDRACTTVAARQRLPLAPQTVSDSRPSSNDTAAQETELSTSIAPNVSLPANAIPSPTHAPLRSLRPKR